ILTIAAGANGMVGGQSLDIKAEGKKLTLEQLRTIHHLKTGKLIAACIMMPLILVSGRTLQHFEKLADLLGVAYQMQDDLLDVESSTAILGKENGIDVKLQKNTYPQLMGLEGTKKHLYAIQQEIQ